MPIVVTKVDDLYEADVTPPHGRGQAWHSKRPMKLDDLIGELLKRGCHQTDIGDAFYAADPDWLSHADKPQPRD